MSGQICRAIRKLFGRSTSNRVSQQCTYWEVRSGKFLTVGKLTRKFCLLLESLMEMGGFLMESERLFSVLVSVLKVDRIDPVGFAEALSRWSTYDLSSSRHSPGIARRCSSIAHPRNYNYVLNRSRASRFWEKFHYYELRKQCVEYPRSCVHPSNFVECIQNGRNFNF